MRVTVLTNFEDYESSINCDKYGVITLILKPNYKNDISFKINHFKKSGSTKFQCKFCTLYKKSSNDILYKYTNHEPQLNTFESQYVTTYKHNIPLKEHYMYYGFKKYLFSFYYDYKAKKSVKMYRKYYLHRFY